MSIHERPNMRRVAGPEIPTGTIADIRRAGDDDADRVGGGKSRTQERKRRSTKPQGARKEGGVESQPETEPVHTDDVLPPLEMETAKGARSKLKSLIDEIRAIEPGKEAVRAASNAEAAVESFRRSDRADALAERAALREPRDRFLAAEDAYLQAYRASLSKKRGWGRTDGAAKRSLKEVEARFRLAQQEYIASITASVHKRFDPQERQVASAQRAKHEYEELKERGELPIDPATGKPYAAGAWMNMRMERFNSSMEARTAKFKAEYEELKKQNKLPRDPQTKQPYTLEDWTAERIEQRYSKMVAYREVIRPSLKRKALARAEALDAKGTHVLQKTGIWLVRKNSEANARAEAALRNRLEQKLSPAAAAWMARNIVRGTRLTATTALVTGGAFALGGVGAIGALGFAGSRLATAGLAVFGGAAAGRIAGKAYELTGGLWSKLESDYERSHILASAGKLKAKDLQKIERSGEAGTAEAVRRRRAQVETVTAVLTALGVSSADAIADRVVEVERVREAAELMRDLQPVPPPLEHESISAVPPPGNVPDLATMGNVQIDTSAEELARPFENLQPPPEPLSPEAVEAQRPHIEAGPLKTLGDVQLDAPAEVSPAAGTAIPEGLAVGATIHEAGQGTDQLFLELKQHIRANLLADTVKPSAVTQHILDAHPNVLSREMGDVFGERGIVTQIGDQFFLDEHQNLWYQPQGGEPQLYMENDPSAESGFVVHELDATPLPPAGETPPVAPEPAPAAPPAAVDVPVTPEVQAPRPSEEVMPEATGDTSIVLEEAPPAIVQPAPLTAAAVEQATRTPAPQEDTALPSEEGARELDVEEAIRVFERYALEPYENTLGVRIEPAVPHAYEWTPQGSSERYVFAYGGTTPEQTAAWAREYALKHPGTTVYFDSPTKDPVTGTETHRVDAWRADGTEPIRGALRPDGSPLRAPAPGSEFTAVMPN